MSEIARRAGISKSSLYREHESKDALYVAVVTDWTEQGRDAMRPYLDRLLGSPQLEEGLQAFASVLLEAVQSPEVVDMRRLVAAEATRFPDVAESYLAMSWRENIAALADTLLSIANRGCLDIDDSYTAAEQLVWLTVGPALNVLTITGRRSHMSASSLVLAAVKTFISRYGK